MWWIPIQYLAVPCCHDLLPNEFPVTTEEGVKSQAEADWLQHNMIVVELNGDQTWFVPGISSATLAAVSAGA